MDDKLKKEVDDRALEVTKRYAKEFGFTDRKIADTPTDALSVVPRKYITMNGVTANRPASSVVGQRYFDTSLAAGVGLPIYWNGTGWIDAAGNFV